MNYANMKTLTIGVITSVLLLSGCKEDNLNNSSPSQTSSASFYLTDAPGDFEEVNVEIIGLEIVTDSGKIEVPINEGVYNLLDFTNGVDTLLGETSLQATSINQIRLILGDNNQVKVDGALQTLVTPSAQQSGLKLNVNQTLVGGLDYQFVIDFDAAKSIVITGNGKYILKPVLRVKVRGPEAKIKGVVQDAVDNTHMEQVLVISTDLDTMSTYSTLSGAFTVGGLSAGTYTVVAGTSPNTASVHGVVVLETTTTTIDTLVIQ